jgi:predicted MPP superfamily phosphohydrolase
MLSRRTFLRASAAAGVTALGLGGYTWQVEPHWLEIVQRTLPVPNLPSALAGARLAQLSDLHVGPRVSAGYLARTFRRVSALRPDLVVYTGDFTTHHRDVLASAEQAYAEAPLGRLGTFGVLGNHDYGPGWSHPEVAAGLRARLESRGIAILQNEVREVGGLQIVGLGDLWARRFDPKRALASLDRHCAAIALTHNPDTVDRPGWTGFQGWILAGHTHGGQCKPPFLPPPLLPVRNRRYTAGEFSLSGDRRMYISRGVGYVMKVRFNVRPEVTLFTLVPA